jgi:hypothetical protein
MFDMSDPMSNIVADMSDVSADALATIFRALEEQMRARGLVVHLVVIGGSGLLAMGLGDRPTQDVDVVAFLQDDQLVSARPFPPELDEAARRVAADFGLTPGWLKSGPTALLEIAGLPAGFVGRLTTTTYGEALNVSFASRFDQVQLKLYALADRQEARDEQDLRRLDPTEQELRAGAEWARAHNAPGPFDHELATALAKFGVEDVGREP